MILLAILSAFAGACAASLLLGRLAGPLGLIDLPNARSLHDAPKPRSGGIAIWAGVATGMIMTAAWFGVPGEIGWIAAAALLTGVVSLIDDRSHVPAWVRLVIQAIAGGLLIVGGLALNVLNYPGNYIYLSIGTGSIISLFLIVWLINLYNFMDGMDGFAAGMAVFGFGTLGVLGLLGGDARFTALCWVIAAAAGGFLVWNFPPARIFMGDSGSSVLGLLAAAFSLWGDRLGLFPLWAALLVFSPFIVDATATLAWRIARGERFWEAHRTHFYQRLAQADGWGHGRTLFWEFVMMALCCACALIAVRLQAGVQWIIILLIGLFYLAAALWISRRTRVSFPYQQTGDK